MEVAFDGLQASPRYPGGLALRFARVKGYRPDKRADEADTIEAVRALYARQAAVERASALGLNRTSAERPRPLDPGRPPATRDAATDEPDRDPATLDSLDRRLL